MPARNSRTVVINGKTIDAETLCLHEGMVSMYPDKINAEPEDLIVASYALRDKVADALEDGEKFVRSLFGLKDKIVKGDDVYGCKVYYYKESRRLAASIYARTVRAFIIDKAELWK